jgi:hypothetical protein
MMAKRKAKHLPSYDYERASYRGIAERLALVSLVQSRSWKLKPGNVDFLDETRYFHSVRYMSKDEGWEANFNWWDNTRHVRPDNAIKAAIAIAIEGARNAYYDNQHPSKELLAIVASAAAKKAA